MQESFSPKQELLKHIRLWWVPIVFACAGAIIGLVFSYIIPAQYEAQAEINVAVDFSKIGVVTDIEQDQIVEMVGDICKSDIVISRLIERVPDFSADDFAQMYHLERRNMKWVLKMRHADAEFVSELVHNWQAVSYEEIQVAYEHAILADSYTDYINSLTGCFEQSIAQPSGSTACSFLTIPEMQDEMSKIAVQIKQEQKLSQGISPAISVSVTNQEKQPAQQVRGIKVWLILAGGFIGFLLGIWGIPEIYKRSVKS